MSLVWIRTECWDLFIVGGIDRKAYVEFVVKLSLFHPYVTTIEYLVG